MPATDLILIRHGETDLNRELRFQGHVDAPLNAAGLEQARRVALRLAHEPIARVVSSDLIRARQTAAPAARHFGLAVAATDGLREQHFGIVEGLRSVDIQRDHPRAWVEWLRFEEDMGMPGGESPRQFHTRIVDAIRAVALQYPGQTVLVTTHGGVLDMVWRTARGLSVSGPRQSDIPNGGFNRVRVADAGAPFAIEILDWADTRHLDGLPPQPVYEQRGLAIEAEAEAA